LSSDGSVYAWGNNDRGQLGDSTPGSNSTPVKVGGLLSGITVTAIAAGELHSLALSSDGNVYAWGNNDRGQLGDDTTTFSPTPVKVGGLLSGIKVTALTAGSYYSLAAGSDGNVYAWGDNPNGQLGDGTTTGSPTPVKVTGLFSGVTVTALAAGRSHSLALRSDGSVYAWGDNMDGQLGDNTTQPRSTAAPVCAPGRAGCATDPTARLTGVTAIAAGGYHSLAAGSDGTVYAWGNNDRGQLGDGTTDLSLTPVKLGGPLSGIKITALAAGFYHSMAVSSRGTVYAWGSNELGQLGNGTSDNYPHPTPKAVHGLPAGVTITAIAAGIYHSLTAIVVPQTTPAH
jgi:alpha-tubulin suppressor-like RCC1 family protein